MLKFLLPLMLALPVSETLDTVFTRIQGSGAVDASLSLAIPVMRPQDYQLNARFDANSCDLGFDGLAFQLDEIRGVVELNNTRLSVQPVRDDEWALICNMGGVKA